MARRDNRVEVIMNDEELGVLDRVRGSYSRSEWFRRMLERVYGGEIIEAVNDVVDDDTEDAVGGDLPGPARDFSKGAQTSWKRTKKPKKT